MSAMLCTGYFCKEKLLLSSQNSSILYCSSASAYFPYFRAIPVQRYYTRSQSRFLILMVLLQCDVVIYKLQVGNFLSQLRVTFCELKIKITSCQSILRVASYYSRVMSYFLRVENKNYELQVMALFHLKKKHSEDRKSLLPV